MPVFDDSVDFRQKYKNLKKKFKLLIYENECFQEELRKAQRKLLKVSRDKSFLLDRLLQYESVDSSSSDSDATESSDSDSEQKHELPPVKKKKPTITTAESVIETATAISSAKPSENVAKKKKPTRKTPSKLTPTVNSTQSATTPTLSAASALPTLALGDGHMTSEEIERHLEAKQALRDLLPEKAPLTVPVEMFSTEPSTLDSEMNDSSHGDSPQSRMITEDDGLVIDLPD